MEQKNPKLGLGGPMPSLLIPHHVIIIVIVKIYLVGHRHSLRQQCNQKKSQKFKLETTVYKFFDSKIHKGYICGFDPKEGYRIKYQDGEGGSQNKPNQTKQHWHIHFQQLDSKECMQNTATPKKECQYHPIFQMVMEKQ